MNSGWIRVSSLRSNCGCPPSSAGCEQPKEFTEEHKSKTFLEKLKVGYSEHLRVCDIYMFHIHQYPFYRGYHFQSGATVLPLFTKLVGEGRITVSGRVQEIVKRHFRQGIGWIRSSKEDQRKREYEELLKDGSDGAVVLFELLLSLQNLDSDTFRDEVLLIPFEQGIKGLETRSIERAIWITDEGGSPYRIILNEWILERLKKLFDFYAEWKNMEMRVLDDFEWISGMHETDLLPSILRRAVDSIDRIAEALGKGGVTYTLKFNLFFGEELEDVRSQVRELDELTPSLLFKCYVFYNYEWNNGIRQGSESGETVTLKEVLDGYKQFIKDKKVRDIQNYRVNGIPKWCRRFDEVSKRLREGVEKCSKLLFASCFHIYIQVLKNVWPKLREEIYRANGEDECREVLMNLAYISINIRRIGDNMNKYKDFKKNNEKIEKLKKTKDGYVGTWIGRFKRYAEFYEGMLACADKARLSEIVKTLSLDKIDVSKGEILSAPESILEEVEKEEKIRERSRVEDYGKFLKALSKMMKEETTSIILENSILLFKTGKDEPEKASDFLRYEKVWVDSAEYTLPIIRMMENIRICVNSINALSKMQYGDIPPPPKPGKPLDERIQEYAECLQNITDGLYEGALRKPDIHKRIYEQLITKKPWGRSFQYIEYKARKPESHSFKIGDAGIIEHLLNVYKIIGGVIPFPNILVLSDCVSEDKVRFFIHKMKVYSHAYFVWVRTNKREKEVAKIEGVDMSASKGLRYVVRSGGGTRKGVRFSRVLEPEYRKHIRVYCSGQPGVGKTFSILEEISKHGENYAVLRLPIRDFQNISNTVSAMEKFRKDNPDKKLFFFLDIATSCKVEDIEMFIWNLANYHVVYDYCGGKLYDAKGKDMFYIELQATGSSPIAERLKLLLGKECRKIVDEEKVTLHDYAYAIEKGIVVKKQRRIVGTSKNVPRKDLRKEVMLSYARKRLRRMGALGSTSGGRAFETIFVKKKIPKRGDSWFIDASNEGKPKLIRADDDESGDFIKKIESLTRGSGFILVNDSTRKICFLEWMLYSRIPFILSSETGVGKTYLLGLLVNSVLGKGSTLKYMPINAGMSDDDIINLFDEEIFKDAKAGGDAYVFLDELNTPKSDAARSLIKEILIDKSVNGRPLPGKVVVFGAINPGGKESSNLRYRVYELPMALKSHVTIDFGKMEDVEEYIEEMIKGNSETLSKLIEREKHFKKAILSAHEKLSKFLGGTNRTTLRDLRRFIRVYNFLVNEDGGSIHKGIRELFGTLDSRKAFFVAFDMVYVSMYGGSAFAPSSFDDKTEERVEVVILGKLGLEWMVTVKQVTKRFGENIKKKCKESLSETIFTSTLLKNLMALVLSVPLKVPVFISGEQPAAKSYSAKIGLKILKCLEEKLDYFWIQCTSDTTDVVLHKLFENLDREDRFVGILDHLESARGMKVLHEILEEMSNGQRDESRYLWGLMGKDLDPAQMNRAMVIKHQRVLHWDVKKIVGAFIGKSQRVDETEKERSEHLKKRESQIAGFMFKCLRESKSFYPRDLFRIFNDKYSGPTEMASSFVKHFYSDRMDTVLKDFGMIFGIRDGTKFYRGRLRPNSDQKMHELLIDDNLENVDLESMGGEIIVGNVLRGDDDSTVTKNIAAVTNALRDNRKVIVLFGQEVFDGLLHLLDDSRKDDLDYVSGDGKARLSPYLAAKDGFIIKGIVTKEELESLPHTVRSRFRRAAAGKIESKSTVIFDIERARESGVFKLAEQGRSIYTLTYDSAKRCQMYLRGFFSDSVRIINAPAMGSRILLRREIQRYVDSSDATGLNLVIIMHKETEDGEKVTEALRRNIALVILINKWLGDRVKSISLNYIQPVDQKVKVLRVPNPPNSSGPMRFHESLFMSWLMSRAESVGSTEHALQQLGEKMKMFETQNRSGNPDYFPTKYLVQFLLYRNASRAQDGREDLVWPDSVNLIGRAGETFTSMKSLVEKGEEYVERFVVPLVPRVLLGSGEVANKEKLLSILRRTIQAAIPAKFLVAFLLDLGDDQEHLNTHPNEYLPSLGGYAHRTTRNARVSRGVFYEDHRVLSRFQMKVRSQIAGGGKNAEGLLSFETGSLLHVIDLWSEVSCLYDDIESKEDREELAEMQSQWSNVVEKFYRADLSSVADFISSLKIETDHVLERFLLLPVFAYYAAGEEERVRDDVISYVKKLKKCKKLWKKCFKFCGWNRGDFKNFISLR